MSRDLNRPPRGQSRPWLVRMRRAAILAFFGISVVALTFAIVGTINTQRTQACGVPGAPACTTVAWAKLRSSTPPDVLLAAQSTIMYQNALKGNDPVAQALQNGHPGTSVLVRPYRQDAGLSQYWVIPIIGPAGYPTALLTFEYDSLQQRLQAAEFAAVTDNMFYTNHGFPFLNANQASASVQRLSHVALLPGQTPQLIYFPADHQALIQGQTNWQGGGTTVIDPIWRVADALGRWQYVDHVGQVHAAQALPLEQGLPVMPSSSSLQ